MVEEAIESVSVVIDQEIHILQGDVNIEEDLTQVDLTAQIEVVEEDVPEEEREVTLQEEGTQTEADLIDQSSAEEAAETTREEEILKTAEMLEDLQTAEIEEAKTQEDLWNLEEAKTPEEVEI